MVLVSCAFMRLDTEYSKNPLSAIVCTHGCAGEISSSCLRNWWNDVCPCKDEVIP